MNKETNTILLIDDDEILLSGLSVLIKRAGYNVQVANKSSEGLQLARSMRPDLIICDVIMPYPNGFELRQLLEKDPTTSKIPFIFLTSRSSQKEKVYGLDAGADDYIIKPFDQQELMARIIASLRRSRREQEKAQALANQEMEEIRREVVRNLSHELRTPINVVLGELQMAIWKRFYYDPSQQPLFLHTVVRNTNHMQTLVNDLLILSQIDQENLDTLRQELDVDNCFYPLIQETQTRWQHRHIKLRFTVDTTITISAPPNGFKQAVRHLLDNACKFSRSHSTVEILLAENGKGGCILTVTDEGPGIPPQYHENVEAGRHARLRALLPNQPRILAQLRRARLGANDCTYIRSLTRRRRADFRLGARMSRADDDSADLIECANFLVAFIESTDHAIPDAR